MKKPEREQACAAALTRVAAGMLPELQGSAIVLLTPRGVFMQPGGSVDPRELATHLRKLAERIEAGASPILLPRRH